MLPGTETGEIQLFDYLTFLGLVFKCGTDFKFLNLESFTGGWKWNSTIPDSIVRIILSVE